MSVQCVCVSDCLSMQCLKECVCESVLVCKQQSMGAFVGAFPACVNARVCMCIVRLFLCVPVPVCACACVCAQKVFVLASVHLVGYDMRVCHPMLTACFPKDAVTSGDFNYHYHHQTAGVTGRQVYGQ